MQDWPRIAVVGAGAVGGYFGAMLARAGASVVMIGRAAFVEAVNARGLHLDAVHVNASVRVAASTELSAARDANLVLVCVKTGDTAATASGLAPFLASDATVVSLQNGVDNADQIRAITGIEALAAVVYVACSVPAPGRIKHVARGDLVVGPPGARSRAMAEVFERAMIPCRVSENIAGELWTKLIWNCALNAISALGQSRYGTIAAHPDAWVVVESAVREVLAVAAALHIDLPAVKSVDQAMTGALKIATDMREALSSTAQDIQRGRRTEIDSLNGYIARRGAEIGVATPVNQTLYALVKLREQREGQ